MRVSIRFVVVEMGSDTGTVGSTTGVKKEKKEKERVGKMYVVGSDIKFCGQNDTEWGRKVGSHLRRHYEIVPGVPGRRRPGRKRDIVYGT